MSILHDHHAHPPSGVNRVDRLIPDGDFFHISHINDMSVPYTRLLVLLTRFGACFFHHNQELEFRKAWEGPSLIHAAGRPRCAFWLPQERSSLKGGLKRNGRVTGPLGDLRGTLRLLRK